MQPLRLTLLIVGLVFLVALAWWESRRSHQVRGSDLPRPGPEPLERMPERSADWDAPTLELPRMSSRDPEADLPVIEVAPAEFASLEARAEDAEQDMDEGADAHGFATLTADFAADVAADPAPQPVPDEATSMEGPGLAHAMDTMDGMEGMEGLLAELGASQTPDPPISDITESFRDGLLADEHFAVESVTVRTIDAPQVTARVTPPAAEAGPAPAASAPAAAAAASLPDRPATTVVVDWPAADASQVIAVRLVSVGEKFSGRAVRLALAAEGFVLGKFSIFHKPAADGRALLSIASLNKPGTFDVQAIDLQRYSGLNLFTVLPGPMPGPDAVDELLTCAQVLAQRLRGALQDGRGESLSAARTAVMRDAAAAAPT